MNYQRVRLNIVFYHGRFAEFQRVLFHAHFNLIFANMTLFVYLVILHLELQGVTQIVKPQYCVIVLTTRKRY